MGRKLMIGLLILASCSSKNDAVKKDSIIQFDSEGFEFSELYKSFYAHQLKDFCSHTFNHATYSIGPVEFEFVAWREIDESLKSQVLIHTSEDLENLTYYNPFPSKRKVSSFTALNDENDFESYICLIRTENIECHKDPLSLGYLSEDGRIKCTFLEDIKTKISQDDVRGNAFRLFYKSQ